MALRLWRIDELQAKLEERGCVPISGWDERFQGRWWKHPVGGRWFLVPLPEEADENGSTNSLMNCRYPEFVLDELFAAVDLGPLR
jgi:hypothetical protein